MNIAIHTLGCKVNQFESAAMAEALTGRGHTMVPFEGQADAYIINTCSVTAVSDQKSRQMIRRARKTNPDGIVAVCGCYPQTHQEEIQALGVDLVGGTGDRLAFLDLLEQSHQERQPLVHLDNALARRAFEPLSAHGMSGRTRAFLKIEDGCTNFCSYCIIPYARGPVRSMSLADIHQEAQNLVAQGYQEIVVTGIEISSWGHPSGETLIHALETICGVDETVRVRLGSLEPRTITQDFCQRASRLKNLCPHFHLSMQSGCDSVLKRMNRKYDTARYLESVHLLRTYFHNPAITTDLIVGFPGETQAEFNQTLAFLDQCRFSSMHIFPYSIRPGTPAAKMENQISKALKTQRAQTASLVAQAMEGAYLQSLVGTTLTVLFEEEKEGQWQGHAPNYVAVRADGTALHNQIRQVTITATATWGLVGTLC